MKSTEEYLSILRSEKESLFRKYQISNLGLFGSVARYEQREDSDIDIYYESSHMSLFTLCRLKSELEKVLLIYSVKESHLQELVWKNP